MIKQDTEKKKKQKDFTILAIITNAYIHACVHTPIEK